MNQVAFVKQRQNNAPAAYLNGVLFSCGGVYEFGCFDVDHLLKACGVLVENYKTNCASFPALLQEIRDLAVWGPGEDW